MSRPRRLSGKSTLRKMNLLHRVASNLLARQDRSVYAARALPGLLQKLGDGERLFDLAFDDRFPVADHQHCREAKHPLCATQGGSALSRRTGKTTTGSSTCFLNSRRSQPSIAGAQTIFSNSPDLVIAARDVDATRRLFETRTAWQGTRHARLTIAHTLSGDLDEASRHALRTRDWLRHYRHQDRDHQIRGEGPERLDIAAIPLFLTAQDRNRDAIEFMRGWKDWYAYEVGEHLFALLQQRQVASGIGFRDQGLSRTSSRMISGALLRLSLPGADAPLAKKLIAKLARACRRATKLETSDDFHRGAKLRAAGRTP